MPPRTGDRMIDRQWGREHFTCWSGPTEKKYRRLDYSLHGKRKTFAMGSYPDLSLKDARSRRDAAKALVAEGIDPVQHRKIGFLS